MKRTTGNLIFHWLPYLFLGLALVAGLHVNSVNQQRDDRERKRAIAAEARALHRAEKATDFACRTVTALPAIVAAVAGTFSPVPIPDHASPELRVQLEAENERRGVAAHQITEQLTALPEC